MIERVRVVERVRRGNVGPAAIIERRLRGAGWGGFDEFPIGIEIELEPFAGQKGCRATKQACASQKCHSPWPPDPTASRHTCRSRCACDHNIKMRFRSSP